MTLVHVLAGDAEVPAALASYDRARRPRTQKTARTLALWGTIAQWRSPLAATVRDAITALVPPHAFLRASQETLGWRPPTPSRLTTAPVA